MLTCPSLLPKNKYVSLDEMNALLRMLVLFHHEEKATELHESLENLTKTIDESLVDIWTSDQDSSNSMVKRQIILVSLTLDESVSVCLATEILVQCMC